MEHKTLYKQNNNNQNQKQQKDILKKLFVDLKMHHYKEVLSSTIGLNYSVSQLAAGRRREEGERQKNEKEYQDSYGLVNQYKPNILIEIDNNSIKQKHIQDLFCSYTLPVDTCQNTDITNASQVLEKLELLQLPSNSDLCFVLSILETFKEKHCTNNSNYPMKHYIPLLYFYVLSFLKNIGLESLSDQTTKFGYFLPFVLYAMKTEKQKIDLEDVFYKLTGFNQDTFLKDEDKTNFESTKLSQFYEDFKKEFKTIEYFIGDRYLNMDPNLLRMGLPDNSVYWK